jgi:hypothetical protein
MYCFQPLLSNPTCGATAGGRARKASLATAPARRRRRRMMAAAAGGSGGGGGSSGGGGGGWGSRASALPSVGFSSVAMRVGGSGAAASPSAASSTATAAAAAAAAAAAKVAAGASSHLCAAAAQVAGLPAAREVLCAVAAGDHTVVLLGPLRDAGGALPAPCLTGASYECTH